METDLLVDGAASTLEDLEPSEVTVTVEDMTSVTWGWGDSERLVVLEETPESAEEVDEEADEGADEDKDEVVVDERNDVVVEDETEVDELEMIDGSVTSK